ncbi:hypothetical protein HanIR_Chr15g0761061 [Helianthus annuus]|nr:hypothetical protein HanIR_Chr15g0761061 [Helianthus annuus]
MIFCHNRLATSIFNTKKPYLISLAFCFSISFLLILKTIFNKSPSNTLRNQLKSVESLPSVTKASDHIS